MKTLQFKLHSYKLKQLQQQLLAITLEPVEALADGRRHDPADVA